ncbi:MAG: S8 family serine peptidase [Solirubrobacteraceae bacterium]
MSARSRFRLVALLAAVVLGSLTVGGIALAAHSRDHHVIRGTRPRLSAAEIKRLSAAANKRSIIIFRNQLGRLPATARSTRARASAAFQAQASVRAELTQVHARNVKSFSIINAMSATISAAEVKHLQVNPAVRAVVPDTLRQFASLGGGPGPALPAMAGAKTAKIASSGPQQVCPSNLAQPLVEPEAREVMNVAAAEQITDGSGVKVGILADGIDPNNADLVRPDGSHVIFDYQDFSGFGTNAPTDGREAFLDAGTIASQGNQTYDLANFVNPAHPLPPGCNIKIAGVAPGVSLAVMNMQGSGPGFFNSTIIQAIQWAVEHDHVNILNESFGGNPQPDGENDPVTLADEAATAAGVTVVVSSGDSGPFNNIGSPATAPGVIAVGGTTTYRVYRQTTRYGTQVVGKTQQSAGGWENNNITALSSDGFKQAEPGTVSVVAPGDRGWSLCSIDTTHFTGCGDIDRGGAPSPIWAAGGTSASAPETSGTAALVMSAYAKTHGGDIPSPQLVKQIIVSSAQDLGAPGNRQGAGLVDTLKAVQLAESINGGTPQGNSLFVRQTALNATVNAGDSPQFRVDVTNTGTSPQTVTPSLIGRPTPLSNDTGTATLDSASPTYIDGEGNTDSYTLHTFVVPHGADYLNGDITWNAQPTTAQPAGTAVFETLFDPQGQVAAYSLLGTDHGGFGHVEVRQPDAGTWTAVIFTVHNSAAYTGDVQFAYSTENFQSAGSVSPASQTLAPGHSGSFRVRIDAGPAGDESFRLHLGTGSATDGSIPVTVRSLVPITRSGGTFSGNLTGGADTSVFGQTFTYQFWVPWGRPELNLGVQLADHAYHLEGFLTDPNGQPLDVQSTAQFDGSDKFTGFGQTMQFFRGHPQGGLWTVTLLVWGPLDGQRLSEPFQGNITFAPPAVSASGVPNGHHRLTAGQPVTATVQVTNTGNVTKDYFVDPRLDRRTTLLLAGSGTNGVGVPVSFTKQPNWFVPTGTDAFTMFAQANIPIVLESEYNFGNPDAIGPSFGNAAVTRITAPEVNPGFYFGLPEPQGPDGAAGAPPNASANLAAVAHTFPFDSNVTSSSGDVWAQSVDPTASYTPLTLTPGQTGTITVTFTPSGGRHRAVEGSLGVDTFSLDTLSGDEVATIPYEYRVR